MSSVLLGGVRMDQNSGQERFEKGTKIAVESKIHVMETSFINA